MTGSGPALENSELRRVIVLGHTGFIGSRVVRHLRAHHPGVEVVGFSDPRLDLTRREDAERLAPLLGPESVLVICAAIKRQLGESLDVFARNVEMVSNLCRVLERSPAGRVVYFSSAAVYGEETENTAITEDTPVNPTSYYGIAKFTAECLLRMVVAAAPGSSLVVLRPALIYGPGDQGLYGPSGFARKAARDEQIVLWGDGTERREFLYLDDVVEIVRRMVFGSWSGTLNVAAGVSYTFRDVLEILSGLAPNELRIDSRARSKQKVDNVFDSSLLRRVLPGFRFTELREGVRRTFEAEVAADVAPAGGEL